MFYFSSCPHRQGLSDTTKARELGKFSGSCLPAMASMWFAW